MKKRIWIISSLVVLAGGWVSASELPLSFGPAICPQCSLIAAEEAKQTVSPQAEELGIQVAAIIRPQLQDARTGVAALPAWAPRPEGFTPNWAVGAPSPFSIETLFGTLNPTFVMPTCQSLWNASVWPQNLVPCEEGMNFDQPLPQSFFTASTPQFI